MTDMLTSEQRKAIHALQQKVEHADGIKLKMNWDMLASESRSESGTEDYFHYNAQGELLGFLAIYQFGNKVECCGMVDPNKRRRGIAKMLLEQASSDWLKQTPRFLINSPVLSKTGTMFCESNGATYAFTEHQLVCKEVPIPFTKEGVRIRPAVANDEEKLYQLDKEGFGLTTNEVKSLYKNGGAQGTYVIEEDGQTVGKLRVDRQTKESWIYGFVLTKERRGKGIGRAALTDIVHREVTNGKVVWLDVAVDNEAALSLYKTCGFTAEGAQAYYELKK